MNCDVDSLLAHCLRRVNLTSEPSVEALFLGLRDPNLMMMISIKSSQLYLIISTDFSATGLLYAYLSSL